MKQFLTKVEMPFQYQPLVDLATSRVRIKKLIKSMERQVSVLTDPDLLLSKQRKLDKLRIIRDELLELENKLEDK